MAKEKKSTQTKKPLNTVVSMNKLKAMTMDELSEKSRKDHQSIVTQLEKRDNHLCLVVIGAILLVVTVLFFILSFKRVRNKPAGLDISSLQFWICLICSQVGLFFTIFGTVNVLVCRFIRIAFDKEIAAIAKLKDQMADNKN